jgi:hypothetical protein
MRSRLKIIAATPIYRRVVAAGLAIAWSRRGIYGNMAGIGRQQQD